MDFEKLQIKIERIFDLNSNTLLEAVLDRGKDAPRSYIEVMF